MNRLDKILLVQIYCFLLRMIPVIILESNHLIYSVRLVYKEIINKQIYTSNNHILLHLKTHQHSYKDVKSAYHRFSVNISISSTKQQLEIRPQSKTCWLFNLFLLRLSIVNSKQSFAHHTNIERYVSITVKVILSFQGRE